MTLDLRIRNGWYSEPGGTLPDLSRDFALLRCQQLEDDLFRVICEDVTAAQIAADGRFAVESSQPYRAFWTGRYYEIYDEVRRQVLARLPHIAAALEAGMYVGYRPNLANTRMLVIAHEPPGHLILKHARALVGIEFHGRTATSAHIEALIEVYNRDGYVAALGAVAGFYSIGWLGTGSAADARRYLAVHRDEWEPPS